MDPTDLPSGKEWQAFNVPPDLCGPPWTVQSIHNAFGELITLVIEDPQSAFPVGFVDCNGRRLPAEARAIARLFAASPLLVDGIRRSLVVLKLYREKLGPNRVTPIGEDQLLQLLEHLMALSTSESYGNNQPQN